MTDFYEVKRDHCNCHPETCCCDDFEVLRNGKRIASGNNKKALLRLVDAANQLHCPNWDKTKLRWDK